MLKKAEADGVIVTAIVINVYGSELHSEIC